MTLQSIDSKVFTKTLMSSGNNGRIKGNDDEARRLKAYLRQVEAKLFEHYRDLLAG